MTLIDEVRAVFENREGAGTLGEILATLTDWASQSTFREAVKKWGEHNTSVWGEHNVSVTAGAAINVIPFGVNTLSCWELLLVFSFGKNQFDERLQQALDHCSILCPRATKGILFVTDYWDNERFWDSRAASFAKLSLKCGVVFALGVWSGKSISVKQVIP